MDYIELQTAIRGVRRLPSQWESGEIFLNKEDVLDALYLAPHETIVNCKDCKHGFLREYNHIPDHPISFYECSFDSRQTGPEDYCSWGERK